VKIYWRQKSIDALSPSELRTAIEELLRKSSAPNLQCPNGLFSGLVIGMVLGGAIACIAAIPVLAL
jgi:hypothetical protein